jgi:hypothetical protein
LRQELFSEVKFQSKTEEKVMEYFQQIKRRDDGAKSVSK